MTIGEKITHLRSAANMSQETLADKLSVSRQSVSKWEMDQSLPQIDKVLQLCEMFKISTDELLYDKITINRTKDGGKRKNKYFGTDGFRGEANVTLTADHAFKVGRFLGWYYTQMKRRNGCDGPARIVIGSAFVATRLYDCTRNASNSSQSWCCDDYCWLRDYAIQCFPV